MANLPADLPEDWTSNQKITPNGTEVGLTPQHGYNYLMKQVNDAQTEINNIGTTIEAALEDVAKEASVQEIITSIGETDDTGGSTVAGTVMAKLNKNLSQNESNSADLEFIKQLLGSGSQEWQEPGTYSFQVPTGITKITVTACGGGGGGGDGGNASSSGGQYRIGGGGGGAAAIVKQEYTVTSGSFIEITVGRGGSRETNGTATIIGNLVTLAGGKKGTYTTSYNKQTVGGASGGTGGGDGGYGIMQDYGQGAAISHSGNNGILGIGGSGQTTNETGQRNMSGGGGGGSLGNGGNGTSACGNDKLSAAQNGNKGGGGGGGSSSVTSSQTIINKAGSGGNGFVRFEWGL